MADKKIGAPTLSRSGAESKRVLIRWAPELWERVLSAAQRAGETPSSYVRRAVDQRLAREEKDPLAELVALLARHPAHPGAREILDRAAALWQGEHPAQTPALQAERRSLVEEARRLLDEGKASDIAGL